MINPVKNIRASQHNIFLHRNKSKEPWELCWSRPKGADSRRTHPFAPQVAPYMHATRHTAKIKYYTSINAYEINGKTELGAAPEQVEVPVKVEGGSIGPPKSG